MTKYKISNKAVDDLAQIWNYTLIEWSEKQADIYYHMLMENVQVVALNPNLGKKYPEVMENLLGFKAGRHIIFYRKIEENRVEITRILHQQMDLKNRTKD